MNKPHIPATACIAFLLVACAGSDNITPSAPTSSIVSAAYKGLQALYVVDEKHADVQVLKNGTYTLEATVTKGLAYPVGDWLDADGNLYVGDAHNGIVEYKPGASSPSFTYTAREPNGAVTTDRQGHVYEGDTEGIPYGGILEYKQGVKGAMTDCSTNGNPYGVAVDATGNVFAAVDAEDGAFIAEFKGGLKGCKFTMLAQIGELGSMVIDKSGNLVVCEPQAKSVAVLAPPYTKVTRTLGSGYSLPEHVTLSSSNDFAFVTDEGKNAVFIVDYKSGKVVQTINKANGLKTPVGAVDGPNAAY